ncbi:flavoprotein [Streptomyces sp. GC420]|uniref:flavoprotein n=1 Tax=Streptomyces sp. GC420 TaxID=2697568 RepID=UPI0014151AE5|nr:flavoprotein [Streptomyces sp. GC420]NBM15327.1 flavoprotein [Streptomyces sp. GC420]
MRTSRTMYLFSCAAPPLFDVAHVVENAQTRGWDVCLGLTPTAARWLGGSVEGLAALTGHRVYTEHPVPGVPFEWPAPDVLVMAPATFNTINQWALGITEKWVVGVAAEAIGRGVPLIALPCVNNALGTHPQFGRSVGTLREAGVRVLHGEEGGFPANEPGEGRPADFPWHAALDAAGSVDTLVP